MYASGTAGPPVNHLWHDGWSHPIMCCGTISSR